MAYRGQSIHNPVTGEHITFLRTAEDTNDEYVLFDCLVDPGHTPLKPHVHSTQDERFWVLSGTLECLVGKEHMTLHAGDTAVLPRGVKHQWKNVGEDAAHFRVEVSPPRNIERTLEAIAGMAAEGKTNSACVPKNPFRLAQFAQLSETYLPFVPIALQKVGVALGSAMGRVLGWDPTFAEYAESAPIIEFAEASERLAA